MSIRITNPSERLAALKQFFFSPGKLEEKFIVFVRLATGSTTIVAVAGCQGREKAKEQAISELMALGYLSTEIISCDVYSADDLETLGRATDSFNHRNQA